MDLISNPDETKVVVATDHLAKDGSSKIVEKCLLPLTGARVVSTIITDLVSRNCCSVQALVAHWNAVLTIEWLPSAYSRLIG